MQYSSFKKAHTYTVLCLFVLIYQSLFLAAQANNDISYLTQTIDLDAMADTSEVLDAIDLFPVTITFLKTQSLRSLQNIQLISTEVKQQFGSQSVPQILNTSPGVLMHSGAYNTNRITIRGIGSRNLFGTAKVKAYLNDIPLTNGVGETSLEDVDLSLIEDINIIKGPTSSLYGAGLGGMIHLNTRSDGHQEDSWFSTEISLGAYGLKKVVAIGNINLNDNHRIIANINDTRSDGYRNNNKYERKGFAFIGDHTLSNKVRFTWIANYIDLFGQIPSSLNDTDFIEDPRKAAFSWQSVNGFEDYTKFIGGLSVAVVISDKSIWKMSLFTNSFDSYESRPFNIIEEDNNAIGLRSTFTHMINSVLDIKIGLEGFSEKYDWQTYITNDGIQGDQISNNHEDRKYLNLFLTSNYSISNKIQLIGGLNFNTTKYDYHDLFDEDMTDYSGSYRFDAIVSPYLSLNLDLSNNKESRMIAHGLLSHGFSPPSLEETLQPDGQINPDIQPEKGLNIEIGLNGNIKDVIEYRLSGYAMTVKDLLVARRISADQFIGINAGRTQHNGIEATLAYKHAISKAIKLRLQTDLSLHDYTFREFIDDNNDYSGNPLTGTPDHIWRTQLDIDLTKRFKIGFGHYTIGDQSLRDDDSISYDGYTLWHGYVKYMEKVSDRWTMDILFRAENIFNQRYASMLLINAGSFGGRAPRYYYPGLPSNIYMSFRVSYIL